VYDWYNNPDNAIVMCKKSLIIDLPSCFYRFCLGYKGEYRNASILLTAFGSAYEMKEEYQKALEMNEAVQKNLDNPHALVNCGVVRARLGDSGAAERDFTLALKLQPSG
jgi:Flp pilus assembly protein TadD